MTAKILVISALEYDHLMVKKNLREYCILTAFSSRDAILQMTIHQDISLVLINLNQPNLDGLEFLKDLSSNSKQKKIHTIFLTNGDKPKKEIEGLQLAFTDYLRMPIERDSLKERIELHLKLREIYKQYLNDESVFNAIFNQAPIGIAISFDINPFSPDNDEIIIINPMFEQITGRTKEELLKLGWAKITHPDDLEKEINYYNKLQLGEINSYSIEKRCIKPDNSIVWVHTLVASLELSNGIMSKYVCIIQDITKRKETEIALAESERSKSVLLSHLPGMAYRCNYDSEWTMRYVSEGCFELTGYTSESLLYNKDLSFKDLIVPEYRDALWNEWERVIAKKLPFKYEYKITTAKGQQKWVLEMGQGIYNELGKVEVLEGIILDISATKEIENILKFPYLPSRNF